MAYIVILLSPRRNLNTCREWDFGIIYEKIFAKANNDITVCQGKPLECLYYKDCGAD